MTTEESGTVRITQREVYDKVLAVDDAVGKMTGLLETHIELTKQNQASTEARLGSVDNRLEVQATHLNQHDSTLTALDGRVGVVETKLSEATARKASWPQTVGAVTGIVAGAGALVGLFIALSNIATALGSA